MMLIKVIDLFPFFNFVFYHIIILYLLKMLLPEVYYKIKVSLRGLLFMYWSWNFFALWLESFFLGIAGTK